MAADHMTDSLQDGENSLWRSFRCRSQDGLSLHTRVYGVETAHWPVICLPGLARTSADFHELATHLSTHAQRPRQVIAMDYRGRGRSDIDPNPANYDVRVEMQDVQDVLTALGVHYGVVVGTSRGGLIAMGLAAVRPTLIRAVVMNDIGPVIEGKGLARIKGYVGKLPQPRDYAEAVDLVKRIASQHFPKLTAAEWERFARRTFKEANGRLVADYDPQLFKSLDVFDLEKPLPVLWQYFEGLKGVPLLSIRGEHSDLFAEETQAEMLVRHPLAEAYVATGEGHAPLLGDASALRRITNFIAASEDSARKRAA
jgi:pimeloyl-ACP methyl ester carboxylesterase